MAYSPCPDPFLILPQPCSMSDGSSDQLPRGPRSLPLALWISFPCLLPALTLTLPPPCSLKAAASSGPLVSCPLSLELIAQLVMSCLFMP